MTLESRSARTLSLGPNCESVSASLTMTGRPVSMHLAHDAVADRARRSSVMASRFTLRDARMRAGCAAAERSAAGARAVLVGARGRS